MDVDCVEVGNIGVGEDNLITYAMPADSLYINDKAILYKGWGITANNANAKTLKVYFGSQLLAQLALTVSIAGRWAFEALIVRTGVATQVAYCEIREYDSAGGSQNPLGFMDTSTPTEDETGAITVKATGTATANDDIVQKGNVVSYLNM